MRPDPPPHRQGRGMVSDTEPGVSLEASAQSPEMQALVRRVWPEAGPAGGRAQGRAGASLLVPQEALRRRQEQFPSPSPSRRDPRGREGARLSPGTV